MNKYDFDQVIPRIDSDSIKWDRYPRDVLPLWVADMDFPSPPEIFNAIRDRLAHPFLGYGKKDDELLEIICDWVDRRYRWKIKPEWILLVPGVVTGMNWAIEAFIEKDEKICFHTPVYPPFLNFAEHAGVESIEIPLYNSGKGFFIDFGEFSKLLDQKVKIYALCNPHNPVGRVFDRTELEKTAEICLIKKTLIFSDEIHCDLIYDGREHIPIASLSEEVANHSVTLMAPSKTFNIPGLNFSYAIVPNRIMRKRMEASRKGLVGCPEILSLPAAKAAYLHGEEWLNELLAYLVANRDYLYDYLCEKMPGIKYYRPEGTYLAWLDCQGLGLKEPPFKFFLEKAKVALNNGKDFGGESERFVRLNFGTPRIVLQSALDRMSNVIGCKE